MTYHRVLLKLSGEALAGDKGFGLDSDTVMQIAKQIHAVHQTGIQICIVIGGGNIFRGLSAATQGTDRTTADYMGMLATVINALAVQNALENAGVSTRVLSAIPMQSICEAYIRRRALRHMDKGRVVIFAAGTGNPFFTTDTAAALRASEMDCDCILKGTKVDGVYDSDPVNNPNAKRYDRLTYRQVISDDLKVMDTSAINLSQENKIPIIVFSIKQLGSFSRVLKGEGHFTLITQSY